MNPQIGVKTSPRGNRGAQSGNLSAQWSRLIAKPVCSTSHQAIELPMLTHRCTLSISWRFRERLNIAVTLAFAAAIAPPSMFSPQVDINTTVARAETAYYEARFDDATAMLAPLNILLDGQPDRKQEKIRVKLQLALSYIGLNQFAKAKALFSELYDLDPQFSIDRSKFTSKVLNLADEAKT